MYMLTALRERTGGNDCHLPAGTPEGGQWGRKDDPRCAGRSDDEVSLIQVGADQYRIFDARYGRAIRVKGVRGMRDTFPQAEATRRMARWLTIRKTDPDSFYKGTVQPHEFEDMLGYQFGIMRESQAKILKRFAIYPKVS